MNTATKENFNELAALIGKDMSILKQQMAILCENQHSLLEEIQLVRNELATRMKKVQ